MRSFLARPEELLDKVGEAIDGAGDDDGEERG
jgi:hypothetical protein